MPLSQYILFLNRWVFWFNLIVFFCKYWKQRLHTLLMWILSISLTVFEIFYLKVSRVWPKKWLLTFRGHLRSKIFLLFESLYETSYLISIDTFYLVPFFRYSTSKFLRIDLDLWHLYVTWGLKYFHYSKAHTWLPIYFLLTLSLDLVPFSRYSNDLKDFGVWPWP